MKNRRIIGLALGFGLLLPSWGGAAVSMTVTVHKISDNTEDAEIAWPAITLPAGWVVASHYLQIDSTMTEASDGIQMYTDNTANDANPKYLGPVNSVSPVPAGLIHTNGLLKLPTAWRIVTSVSTPAPVDPNAQAGESSAWLFHEDQAQVANNQDAAKFSPGDPYITIENTLCPGGLFIPCIHYGQRPVDFGAESSPNYVYLEADFTHAMAASTYRTSTLRIEAFSQ